MASEFEEEFKAVLRSRGWNVLNCGWPDLLIHKKGFPITAVEIKSKGDKVKPHQKEVLTLLARHGIRTVVAFQEDCYSPKISDWRKFNTEFEEIAYWNDINAKYLRYVIPSPPTNFEFDGIGVS